MTRAKILCAMALTQLGAAQVSQLFAVTTDDNCAERLPYGPNSVTLNANAYIQTSGLPGGGLHSAWGQELQPTGQTSSRDITILYTFASAKTLAQRFIDASTSGESVTWQVTDASTTTTFSGTYWFSNSARMASKFSGSGNGFSGDDGAWGGAPGIVQANGACPANFWGHANFNSADSDCRVYRGSCSGMKHPSMKNYMYIGVSPRPAPTPEALISILRRVFRRARRMIRRGKSLRAVEAIYHDVGNLLQQMYPSSGQLRRLLPSGENEHLDEEEKEDEYEEESEEEGAPLLV